MVQPIGEAGRDACGWAIGCRTCSGGRARDAVAGTVTGEPTTAQLSPEPAGEPTRVEGMRAKIKAGGHASPYRLRKQLPEPVFGQIKQARGFRQFLLRCFSTGRRRRPCLDVPADRKGMGRRRSRMRSTMVYAQA
jgi:hypothetical protein